MTFTVTELRECAEREVKLRERVYPGRIMTGRMTSEYAARQIAMMEEIARRLRAEEQAELLV